MIYQFISHFLQFRAIKKIYMLILGDYVKFYMKILLKSLFFIQILRVISPYFQSFFIISIDNSPYY